MTAQFTADEVRPGTEATDRLGGTNELATDRVEDAVGLAGDLVDAWGSWGPNMTPDARQVAFVSDRSGVPQLWLQDVVLDGPYLDRVKAALGDPAAKRRGLFRDEVVRRMLADPNANRTTLGSNALWQLALLEMWLQHHDIS